MCTGERNGGGLMVRMPCVTKSLHSCDVQAMVGAGEVGCVMVMVGGGSVIV